MRTPCSSSVHARNDSPPACSVQSHATHRSRMVDGEEAAHLGERAPIVGRQLNCAPTTSSTDLRGLRNVHAPNRIGSQLARLRCTRTANSAHSGDDKATSPSMPAVRRPALRWVTCRTLISVFDHDPSINFCSDRTVAQSCSRVALKILRRNRITFCSWTRQSTKSHSTATSSGPFTAMVSNLPLRFIRPPASVFKGSPAHVSTLASPAPLGPTSGRFPTTTAWSSSHAVASPVAVGHRHPLLGHPVPPRDYAPLTIGLPKPLAGLGPRRGFHVPRTRDTAGVGAPYTPRPAVFPTTGSHFPVAACRPFQRPGPITQVFIPSSRARNNEASSGVHSRSPARPSPRPVAPPDGTGALRLLPWASHPDGQDPSTHAKAGIDPEH